MSAVMSKRRRSTRKVTESLKADVTASCVLHVSGAAAAAGRDGSFISAVAASRAIAAADSV